MHAALIPSLAILLVAAVFAPASASGAGLTLRGSVVHSDGLPAVRARVDIATAKPRHGLGVLCPSCYADCRKSTFTDQEGSFQFADLDPSLTFRLLVTKPGSLTLYSHSLDPLENDTPVGRVPLFLAAAPTDVPPERLVRGRLVDATGRPIAGGLVSAEAECTADRTSYGRGVTTPVASDDDGRFELIAPEPIVRVSLEVFAEGYAGMLSDELAPGGQEHTLRVPIGASVSVRIERDGVPIPDLQLAVVQTHRACGRHFVKDVPAVTDADGVARFEHLPPDEQYALFSLNNPPQDLVITTTLFKAPGDAKARDLGTIAAAEAKKLSGKVTVEGSGTIPADAKVSLSQPRCWGLSVTEVATDGTFEFRGLSPESYLLNVRANGLTIDESRVGWQVVDRGGVGIPLDESRSNVVIPLVADRQPNFPEKRGDYQNAVIDGDLVLVDPAGIPLPLRSESISGIVVDPEGRPVPGVDVSVWAVGFGVSIGPRSKPTGADGRFSLNAVPDVPTELRASIHSSQSRFVEFGSAAVAVTGTEARLVIDPRLARPLPDLDPPPDPAVAQRSERRHNTFYYLSVAATFIWCAWPVIQTIRLKLASRSRS